MENPRKRKRDAITNTVIEPDDTALTQSKTTRRQLDIDAQIIFLSQGKEVQLEKPPRKNQSSRNSILQAT